MFLGDEQLMKTTKNVDNIFQSRYSDNQIIETYPTLAKLNFELHI